MMALSKALVAALAVAGMALLTLTAAAPAADAAAAADAATAAYDALHIEGLSGAAEAPALAGLADHSSLYQCRSYFQCQVKSVNVVAKHTYPCYYKIATRAFESEKVTCRKNPYKCVPAACVGWVKCLCDACKTVAISYPVWCER